MSYRRSRSSSDEDGGYQQSAAKRRLVFPLRSSDEEAEGMEPEREEAELVDIYLPSQSGVRRSTRIASQRPVSYYARRTLPSLPSTARAPGSWMSSSLGGSLVLTWEQAEAQRKEAERREAERREAERREAEQVLERELIRLREPGSYRPFSRINTFKEPNFMRDRGYPEAIARADARKRTLEDMLRR